MAEHNLVFTAVNVGAGAAKLGGGGSYCRNCTKDDEAFVTEEALTAWENLFVASLRKDTSGDFKYVGQCQITMSANAQTL